MDAEGALEMDVELEDGDIESLLAVLLVQQNICSALALLVSSERYDLVIRQIRVPYMFSSSIWDTGNGFAQFSETETKWGSTT